MAVRPIVLTYDPKKVILTVGGVPVSGYTDGTFIQVEPNSATFTKSVGADGEVVRSKSNDNTHTITITLQQSSLSNDHLSILADADKKSNAGMVPVSIKDANGTSNMFWAQCWVETDPTWNYDKVHQERTWSIHTGQQTGAHYGGIPI